MPRKPVRLPPRPAFLAGREELLAELDTRLTGGDDPGPRTVVLCGLGGTGKTSVAVAYAHRHLADVWVAWQFPAEDPTVLAAGFGELAAQLGTRDATDGRDPVASVHSVLAAFADEWLLVFDNAPDRASVEGFLPPAGRGRVLITTQSAVWPGGWALDVPVLDREVAAELLVTRSGDADQRAAEDLAARDLFRLITDAYTEDEAYGPEHADTLIARANLASWTGQAGDAAAARDQYAALLPIEEQMLGAEAPDTLTTRGNLASWTGQAGDAAGARDQFAALVPMRERVLGPGHPGTLTARGNLAYWTGMAGDAAAARDQFAALVPMRERVSGPEHPGTLTGRGNLARFTGMAGDAASARDQYAALEPVVERVLGPQHPDTLTARGNLAYWTGMAGDAAAARDQFAALVPMRERVSGPEHPGTLTARGNLARFTGMAGNAASARDQLAALVPMRERVSGPEHPDTLTDRDNLAHWTRRAEEGVGPGVD